MPYCLHARKGGATMPIKNGTLSPPSSTLSYNKNIYFCTTKTEKLFFFLFTLPTSS